MKPSVLAPYELEVLLWHYYSPREYKPSPPRNGLDEVYDRFLKEDLLSPSFPEKEGYALYKITDKGTFYIERILATPLPIEETRFVIPGDPQ